MVNSQAEDGERAVTEIVANMGTIQDSVDEVSQLFNINSESTNEIAAATEEQLASMEEIQIAASSLTSVSDSLNEMVHRFKI